MAARLVLLSHELRNRRLRAVLSRQQLADKSGVSRARIQELEAGHRLGVRPDTVQRLAQALGCEPMDLVQIIED